MSSILSSPFILKYKVGQRPERFFLKPIPYFSSSKSKQVAEAIEHTDVFTLWPVHLLAQALSVELTVGVLYFLSSLGRIRFIVKVCKCCLTVVPIMSSVLRMCCMQAEERIVYIYMPLPPSTQLSIHNLK